MGLCLTLRAGDGVILDGNVSITVRRIRGKQIRVLVEAPKAVRIGRFKEGQEVLQARTLESELCVVQGKALDVSRSSLTT